MDIWDHAKRIVDSKELELAWRLGFDFCSHCDEWVHQDTEDGVECIGCGWHCPTCAGDVGWQWCQDCGLTYCQNCYGDDDRFTCEVCMMGIMDD